jgi:hypothetical protein
MLSLTLFDQAKKTRQQAIVKQLGTIPFSDEVTEILRREQDNPKHVRVIGLAVDFYLSVYLRDVITKRADGVEGFDPLTKRACFIFKESNLTNYNAVLAHSTNERLQWIESFLFTYLCAACAGELRHAPGRVSGIPQHELDRLEQFKIMTSGHVESRAQTQRNFLKTVTKDRIPDFLKMATEIFNQYKWVGSFGGKKWGDIAKTGLDRLTNSLDRIGFIDRVFDLKHNGGPIFDKNGAVHNMNLQHFLDCKLEMTKDTEWADWLQYSSKSLIDCLALAHKTSLWQGQEDLNKIKLVSCLFNPNDNDDDMPVVKANPPKPAQPLMYTVETNFACPKGEHK